MISVTELIASLKPKVDWEKKAKEKAKEEGVSVDVIQQEWEEARQKGLMKGKILHESKQNDYPDHPNYIYVGYTHSGEKPEYNPEHYVVEEGYIYDERPFMHPLYPLIGYPDRVKIIKGKVHIEDFKSDKVIYKTGPIVKNGRFHMKMKMNPPISHLDCCNYIQYSLQLSLYMRLVLDNNKKLRPGTLKILHSIYDEETLEFLREEVIEIPYYRKEVAEILKRLK